MNKILSRYWPEFAQNGKENIKIEDVLRHVRLFLLQKQKFNFSPLITNNFAILV